MRHQRKTVKLQRKTDHRTALFKNLCKSLLTHGRIRTTLAKAKAFRPIAEKMVTVGKNALAASKNETASADYVHYCRQAFRILQDKTLVKKLVHEVAAASETRPGGYTRITKLGQRPTDSAAMAVIEWVDLHAETTAED